MQEVGGSLLDHELLNSKLLNSKGLLENLSKFRVIHDEIILEKFKIRVWIISSHFARTKAIHNYLNLPQTEINTSEQEANIKP